MEFTKSVSPGPNSLVKDCDVLCAVTNTSDAYDANVRICIGDQCVWDENVPPLETVELNRGFGIYIINVEFRSTIVQCDQCVQIHCAKLPDVVCRQLARTDPLIAGRLIFSRGDAYVWGDGRRTADTGLASRCRRDL